MLFVVLCVFALPIAHPSARKGECDLLGSIYSEEGTPDNAVRSCARGVIVIALLSSS